MADNPRISTGVVGRSGLEQYSGVIYEIELKQLRSQHIRNKIYKEMYQSDSVINALAFLIDMTMRQVDWPVEAANESPKAKEAQEFVESCFDDTSNTWEDTLSEIMTFPFFGFSFHEIVYKYRKGYNTDADSHSKYSDGKLGWAGFPGRSQDSVSGWNFGDNNNLVSMQQISLPPDYRLLDPIPMEKALLFRSSVHKGNPEGKAIFESIYKDYYYMTKLKEIEAIGVERDLAGLPVIYLPVEWTDANAAAGLKAFYEAAKKAVKNVKRGEQEGMVIPQVWDDKGNAQIKFELVSSGGKRSFDIDSIIQRYAHNIARRVLADFLFLGEKAVGSFALSSDKTNLFSVALGAWLDMITGVINRQAIARLCNYNGYNPEDYPILKHGDLEKDDPKIMAEFVSKLSAAGIDFSDIDTQNYLRRLASLPERDEKEFETEQEVKDLDQKALAAEQEETLVDAVKSMRQAVVKAIDKDG